MSIPRGTSTIDFDAQAASISRRSGSTPPHSSTGAREGLKSPRRYQDPTDPRSAAARPPPGTRLISSAGVISGILSRHGVGYLVGVFLPDTLPGGPPPESLDFGGDYDFMALCPQMRQTFFIGDGHTSDGTVQRFDVPTGATRVYLGFTDAWGFRHDPGYYGDNSGSLEVNMRRRSPSSRSLSSATIIASALPAPLDPPRTLRRPLIRGHGFTLWQHEVPLPDESREFLAPQPHRQADREPGHLGMVPPSTDPAERPV